MSKRNRLTEEELTALREQLAGITPNPRPRRSKVRPADRAKIARQASSFGFRVTMRADTAKDAYRAARSAANALAHAAFEKNYRPRILRRGEWAVIIWHDPRASWYGVVMADGNVAPLMSGDLSEVEHAARKALARLCGEAE